MSNVNSYFRVPNFGDQLAGVFFFNESDPDSTREAWNNAIAFRSTVGTRRTMDGRDMPIAVWRRPPTFGPWSEAREVGR